MYGLPFGATATIKRQTTKTAPDLAAKSYSFFLIAENVIKPANIIGMKASTASSVKRNNQFFLVSGKFNASPVADST